VYIASKDIKHSTYLYGLQAEETAWVWYSKKGFTLIGKRHKTPFGELDLVVRKRNLLVFVEVKARHKLTDYEFISQKQVKRNSAAALYFLSKNDKYNGFDMRFDLAIVIKGEVQEVIESAWEAQG
jgi:putative endonuclease